MPLRIRCIQHVAFEGPANIDAWALQRGHRLETTALYNGSPLPEIDTFDWLVVMGGPMSIHEHEAHRWLPAEKALIRDAITRGKVVLGVCLGAQLIADVLGGTVTPGPNREIGWHDVTLTEAAEASALFAGLPRTFGAFHWHGDTFTIPTGAVHIATSEAFANQAFAYADHVVGLQFHLDYAADGIADMLTHCGNELIASPYVQTEAEILQGLQARVASTRALLNALLDAMASAR